MLMRTKRYRKPVLSKPRKLSSRQYSVKSWPTKKIIEVLNEPYTRGVDGRDFGPIKESLQYELNRRSEKVERQRELQDEKLWQSYETHRMAKIVELKAFLAWTRQNWDTIPDKLTYMTLFKTELERWTEKEACPFLWQIFINQHRSA